MLRVTALWLAGMVTASHAFDRDTVSNLLLWVKADAGVTTNASGVVTGWADQSVSSNHLSLLTGNPTLSTNVLNGLPAVVFDGMGDTFSFARITNARTVFWVLLEDGAATANYRPLLGDSVNYDFHRGTSKEFWGASAGANVTGGTTYTNGITVGNGMSAIVPTTMSLITLVTSGDTRVDQLGRDRWVDDRAWWGKVAEVLVYRHALTAGEINTVGLHLENRYGLNTTYEDLTTPQVDPTGGADDLTASSATLHGNLISTGGLPCTVIAYWGTTDGGTVAGSWAHTNVLGTRGVGSLSCGIAGLAEETQYFYRYFASNSSASAWAAPTVTFRTGANVNNWSHRMRIRFPGYTRSEALSNFPVLVTLSTNIPDFRYDRFLSPPYADLRFFSTSLATLDYDVERWDTGGVSWIWVKVPALAGSNDALWAYWGRPNVSLPPGVTNGATWSAGYGGVWHLSENVTNGGIQRDSSGNGGHGTWYDANGNSAAGTNGGVAAGADRLAGDGDDLEVSGGASLRPVGSMTCEIWGRSRTDTWTDNGFLLSKRDAYLLHPVQGTRDVTFYAWEPTVTSISATPDDITNWHYYAGTYDAAAMRLYVDGNLLSSAGGGGAFNYDAGVLCLGRDDGQSRYLDGWLDEARVSLVARSSNWIWACWYNLVSNASFCVFDRIQSPRAGLMLRLR